MTRNPPMALPLPTHIPTVLHLAPQTLSSAARAARIVEMRDGRIVKDTAT